MPLERLKQQLLLHGLTCLRTAHPQYVASLEAQVLAGASFEQLRDEVAKYPTPRFEPWSEIFRLVVEVDLAGWRMSNSLKLLGFAPDQVQLDQMGVTASAWTDYHRMMWLVSSDGLLERMEWPGEEGRTGNGSDPRKIRRATSGPLWMFSNLIGTGSVVSGMPKCMGLVKETQAARSHRLTYSVRSATSRSGQSWELGTGPWYWVVSIISSRLVGTGSSVSSV